MNEESEVNLEFFGNAGSRLTGGIHESSVRHPKLPWLKKVETDLNYVGIQTKRREARPRQKSWNLNFI